MHRFVLTLLLFTFTSLSFLFANATYLKVTAEKGDGVYSLLRRYQLVDEYCNIKQFYKINHLKEESKLFSGKKYFVPILVYEYNGKSIRSTIGKNDWDLAVSIQKFNEDMRSVGRRSNSYKESRELWVPFSTIYCGGISTAVDKQEVVEKVPEVQNNINKVVPEKVVVAEKKNSKTPKRTYKEESLFGKAYAKYEEVDRSLKDKVFYIVSGHGGPDPGTNCDIGTNTVCEDEYAYDVALRLARNLRQHGAIVEMIIQDENDGIRDDMYLKCDRDERCNGQKLPVNQKRRLEQRAIHINALHQKYRKQGYTEHAVIALHVDAAGKGTRKDVFFYHHPNSSRGKEMAHNIHHTFKSKYEKFQKGRGYRGTIRTRGLYMINNTNPPIVYIELANIKNPLDQKRILLNSNRQALANWIFQGIIK